MDISRHSNFKNLQKNSVRHWDKHLSIKYNSDKTLNVNRQIIKDSED